MVWNTGGRGSNVSERAANVSSYPTYDMEYLSNALGAGNSGTKYEVPEDLNGMDRLVYTQKAATGFRREAKQALHNEFSLWLQGQHLDNDVMAEYDNSRKGVVERRHFMDGKVGAKEKWKPTWWGKSQLTHLPGVRQYLIDSKISAERETMDLNQLAEFGPQNLEDAWAYFKTWVKGMPISEAVNFNHAPTRDFDRSNFGSKMPSEMMRNDPLLDTEPTATDTQWRYEWPGAKTNVKTEQKSDPFYFNANDPMRDTDAQPNANATYTPMRDPDAPPNDNATYTPMRDPDAVPPVDSPFDAADRAAIENQLYNRNRTTRTSQYVERGKARQLNRESVRGVGESVREEDSEHARKGIDPRPPSPSSPMNADRPPGPKYTSNPRTRNDENMSDYIPYEPSFLEGGSVPQNYQFNTSQPRANQWFDTRQEAPYFGRVPIPELDETGEPFSRGKDVADLKFDPLRGLEKSSARIREFIRPSARMVSDRQDNPVFVWSAAVFKDRRESQFRNLRGVPEPDIPITNTGRRTRAWAAQMAEGFPPPDINRVRRGNPFLPQ